MGVIGTGSGGYATVDKTRDYIGEAAANVEGNMFRYREEKRLKDDKAEAKRKANEVKDDFKGDMAVTGNTTFNDLMMPYAMEAHQKYSDNVRQINATTDAKERQRLMQVNQKIMQSFDVASQIPTQLNKVQQDIVDGIKDKKYSERDAQRVATMLDAAKSGKGRLYIDEYGQPRMDIYKLDADGKPTAEVAKNQSMAELISTLTPHLRATYDEDVLKETGNYKINEQTTEINGEERTVQKKGEREIANATAFADRILGEPHNRYEIAKRYGIDEKDGDALRTKIQEDYINRIQEVDKQKHDYGHDNNITANKRLNHQISQDAIDNKFKAEDSAQKKQEWNSKYGTTTTAHITTKAIKAGGHVVPAGSGQLKINSKGVKDLAGGVSILKGAYRTDDGEIVYEVREKNINRAKMTPEAEDRKKKEGKDFKLNPDADFETIERTQYYSSKDQSDKYAPAIMNTVNPKTGEYFKDTIEADEWVREGTHTAKSKTTQKQPSQSEWNAKWSKLKKGQTMVGLDGNTYTKN